MPEIKISEDTYKKVTAFRRIIDTVFEEELGLDIYQYADFIIQIGLERMLQDVLPKEEPTLQKTMVQMFNGSPEFVSNYVADTLKRGALIEKEKEEEAKRRWRSFIA